MCAALEREERDTHTDTERRPGDGNTLGGDTWIRDTQRERQERERERERHVQREGRTPCERVRERRE